MKRNILVLAITVVLLAGTALADTFIDTYSDWTGDFTEGNWIATAQTFRAPADNVLVSFRLGIQPRSVDGNLIFSIYAWEGMGPVGMALYSTTLPWNKDTNEILIPGIRLTLTTGTLYGAIIDLQVPKLNSVHWESDCYTGGNAFWTMDMTTWQNFDNSLDLQFNAEFETVSPSPVTIDIKPGGYPNYINLKSEVLVPVAILTTDDFDTSTVDPVTVEFADALPIKWKIVDVDNDGDMDMLFHFKTKDLNLDLNSTEATLTGKTIDATDIVGTDSVNIVSRERKHQDHYNKHCRGRASNGPAFFIHTLCCNPHFKGKACMLH